MELSYQKYKEEAERYCKAKGIDINSGNYDTLDRDELLSHMYRFVQGYYGDAPKSLRIRNQYNERFWREHIRN